jgi:uncharacterized protein YbjT (DUF2867 family)
MVPAYVVCGATGNVGSKVAKSLLAAGAAVRAVGRERVRLGPLAAAGADPWPGDLGDAKFLSRAFSGAAGVFGMIPPKHDAPDLVAYQIGIGEALVSALESARIPRVVTLSSIGAHLFEGTGPIRGLHDMEKMLDRLGIAEVAHLRAAYFMENHLWNVPVIRDRGVNGSPIRPDAPIPMVATKDIAEEAARLLTAETLSGRSVRYLLGPRHLTMTEATRILGHAIGKPDLRYVQFPEEEARKAMSGMGMSDSVIEALLEMQRGFNAGRIGPTQERNVSNTTPTTLEEFAQTVFAQSYLAAA